MTTIKIVTKYSPEMIKQFDMHSSGNAIGNHVERIIMLREQGVQEALSKLGYLNPEEAAKQQEEIESLKEQLKPANIQQFFTFAAIEDMSTKQINEVFTGLHESNISAMAKEKVNQERITKLEADLKHYQYMMCDTCGGTGSVGNAPDDYYDCPQCVQPINEMERKLKAQDAEIIKLVDRLQSCEDDNGLLIEACELISSVIAKHSYRNEDGANIVNILDIEPQCQLIDTVLEATKQEGHPQHERVAQLEEEIKALIESDKQEGNAISSEKIRCWSCDYEQSLSELSHNDGDCIKCAAEIDLSQYPQFEGGE